MNHSHHVGFSEAPVSPRRDCPFGLGSSRLWAGHLRIEGESRLRAAVSVGRRAQIAARNVGVGRRPSLRLFTLSQPCFSSDARSVGNNKDALSPMHRANVGCGNPQGARSIAESRERFADCREPTACATGDVFDDDEARPNLADDSREVPPETAAGAPESSPSSCAGYVLAGEAPAEKIASWVVAWLRDIDEPRDAGPVLRQHGAAEWIDFNLKDDGPETSPLKAEL